MSAANSGDPGPETLRAARVDGAVVDLTLAGGLITAIRPHEPGPGLDLGGRTVVPGLWDNHVHFDQWALARQRLDLSAVGSAAEAVALVAARLRTAPPAEGVLVGAGFRDGLWPDAPRLDLLDAASPGVRVVLVSGDLHCCWLNSAAAAHYGIAPEPSGVVREQDWHPIMEDVRRAADLDRYAAEAARAAAARGVVGIVDFEAPFPLDAWRSRIAAGSRSLRVVSSVWPPALSQALERGARTGDAVPDTDGLLTMGPLKIVTDGSLNTRTAFCVDPYPGLEGTAHPCGMVLVAPSELVPLLERATEGGLDVAVHAIGDAANAFVLDAFAATGARGRVEHAQLLQHADVPRFAALGIVASVQPEHAVDDRDVADHYWAGRTGRAFVFRSLLDAGAALALGSDAPVAPLDPWVAIAAAVHRSGDDRAPWHPEQQVTLAEALAASWGPDGPLREGRRADLAILDADPATCTPTGLREMPVAATMLGGAWTHRLAWP
ncbi:amidohydrolase [Pseudonocardia xishanensis]|uniref:Amidohydrolase family protein n=1 Tax=Pseudonocardia xishanensis TaxID=630995 RepID=A0ABP8S0R1_9PSEU